jgi:hypothetical protein
MSMKIFKDYIGNRTRAVPQQTAPSRAPYVYISFLKINGTEKL